MRYSSMQMNNTSAAACGGSCAARSDFFFLILAGIALAVSVLFCLPLVHALRLCLSVSVIIIISLLLWSSIPQHRKR